MDTISHHINILSVHAVKPQFIEFPIPELLSLTSMHQSTPPLNYLLQDEPLCVDVQHPHQCRNNLIQYLPFIRLSYPLYKNYPAILPSDDPMYIDLNQICDRSVLNQSFVLVLAQGRTYKDLHVGDSQLLESYTQDKNQLLKFEVASGNRCMSKEEQIHNIEFVTDLFDMKGSIDIKHPNRSYWLCEYHSPFHTRERPDYHDSLQWVFFGVQVAYNRKLGRHYVSDFELSTRAYLGPTSTTAPLAFLMSNQAQIISQQVVLDPFVGTGGLLVPAAHFGALTFGSDIDARVIHGHAVGHLNPKSNLQGVPQKPYINLNFEQYGLQLPELIRQDCLKNSFHREFFDAIVCDPPYGIRAASRATGKKSKNKPQQQEEETKKEQKIPKEKYIIPTKKVDHVEIYEQLLNAASKMLKTGGMLVYLYPFQRLKGAATLEDIPVHPMFRIQNYSEETINLQMSRILITMRLQ